MIKDFQRTVLNWFCNTGVSKSFVYKVQLALNHKSSLATARYIEQTRCFRRQKKRIEAITKLG
jgi:hypothetical protein